MTKLVVRIVILLASARAGSGALLLSRDDRDDGDTGRPGERHGDLYDFVRAGEQLTAMKKPDRRAELQGLLQEATLGVLDARTSKAFQVAGDDAQASLYSEVANAKEIVETGEAMANMLNKPENKEMIKTYVHDILETSIAMRIRNAVSQLELAAKRIRKNLNYPGGAQVSEKLDALLDVAGAAPSHKFHPPPQEDKANLASDSDHVLTSADFQDVLISMRVAGRRLAQSGLSEEDQKTLEKQVAMVMGRFANMYVDELPSS